MQSQHASCVLTFGYMLSTRREAVNAESARILRADLWLNAFHEEKGR